MTGTEPPELPLESSPTAFGPAATRAFTLLGNETRLAILLALWDHYDPFAEENSLSFSELLDRVEYETSGNFSYHLEKLEDHYVESTADGYRLRQAGHKIVRAVIAGAGMREPTLEPTGIDAEWVFCGGSLSIVYENEHLYIVCSECDPKGAPAERRPIGTIMGFPFDPAGLSRNSAEEVFAAVIYRTMQKYRMQMGGLCPSCSGPVESSLHICAEHHAGDVCPNCGHREEAQARWICSLCKNVGYASPAGNVFLHPRVLAFYVDHGLEVGYDSNDFETMVRMLQAMANHEQSVLSLDPPRLRVIIPYGDDELRLTIDEAMAVRAVDD